MPRLSPHRRTSVRLPRVSSPVRAQIRVAIEFDVNADTVPAFLSLVRPKLEYQLSLAHKVRLIEALKEIKMQEADSAYLSPAYVEVLENAASIQKQFKQSPRALESLSGIVTDLFVDMHKFKGRDVKHKIPQLMQLLEHYDHDQVVSFITNPN